MSPAEVRNARRHARGASVGAGFMRSTWSARLPRRPVSTTRAVAISSARVSGVMRSARSTNTLPRVSAPAMRGRAWLARTSDLERDLQILHIRRAALVQDHEIHREPLHAPVLVRAQQLAHDRAGRRRRRCAAARSADRPRCLAPTAPAVRAAPRRMSSTAGRSDRHRRTGRGWRDAGTGLPRRHRCRGGAAAPAPASRPASRRARRRVGVVMLVEQVEHCVARRARHRSRTPCAPCRRPARGCGGAGEHRIEHGAGGPRERPAIDHAPSASRIRGRGRGSARGRFRTPVPPITSPSTTARCAAQSSGSSGARRRRVARMAP